MSLRRTVLRTTAATAVAVGCLAAVPGAAAATAGAVQPFVGPIAGSLRVAPTTTTSTSTSTFVGPKATTGVLSKKLMAKRVRRTTTTPTASTAPTAPTASTAPTTAPVAPVTSGSLVETPLAMPTGDLTGWRQVLAQDFAASGLPTGWGTYAGQPGGNPGGWWDPSHVAVRNGKLVLDGHREDGRFVTGGVMAVGTTLTYGKYEVRFRMDKGHGVKYALLLWPESERWPIDGEIDFAEDGGGDRASTSATLHWGADNSQEQYKTSGDFSRWQTIGLEWTPGKIVYTLNGKPWSTVVGSHVPSTPMRLALQTEAGTCGDRWTPCPDATTPAEVDLEVDWVVAYARS